MEAIANLLIFGHFIILLLIGLLSLGYFLISIMKGEFSFDGIFGFAGFLFTGSLSLNAWHWNDSTFAIIFLLEAPQIIVGFLGFRYQEKLEDRFTVFQFFWTVFAIYFGYNSLAFYFQIHSYFLPGLKGLHSIDNLYFFQNAAILFIFFAGFLSFLKNQFKETIFLLFHFVSFFFLAKIMLEQNQIAQDQIIALSIFIGIFGVAASYFFLFNYYYYLSDFKKFIDYSIKIFPDYKTKKARTSNFYIVILWLGCMILVNSYSLWNTTNLHTLAFTLPCGLFALILFLRFSFYYYKSTQFFHGIKKIFHSLEFNARYEILSVDESLIQRIIQEKDIETASFLLKNSKTIYPALSLIVVNHILEKFHYSKLTSEQKEVIQKNMELFFCKYVLKPTNHESLLAYIYFGLEDENLHYVWTRETALNLLNELILHKNSYGEKIYATTQRFFSRNYSYQENGNNFISLCLEKTFQLFHEKKTSFTSQELNALEVKKETFFHRRYELQTNLILLEEKGEDSKEHYFQELRVNCLSTLIPLETTPSQLKTMLYSPECISSQGNLLNSSLIPLIHSLNELEHLPIVWDFYAMIENLFFKKQTPNTLWNFFNNPVHTADTLYLSLSMLYRQNQDSFESLKSNFSNELNVICSVNQTLVTDRFLAFCKIKIGGIHGRTVKSISE